MEKSFRDKLVDAKKSLKKKGKSKLKTEYESSELNQKKNKDDEVASVQSDVDVFEAFDFVQAQSDSIIECYRRCVSQRVLHSRKGRNNIDK